MNSVWGWVIALVAVSCMMHQHDKIRELNERLVDARQTIGGLTIELQEHRAAVLAREAVIMNLRSAVRQFEQRLGEVYEKSDVSRAWGVGICPYDVFECLLKALPDGAADQPADGLSSTGGRAAPARADQ